ncbi:MAG: dTDP-glucose 4,6-dehydratase [Myxococcales bacterium]|nr:dTDP-glucose 4,6-dehydratase [Myxococcales bacterium]
MLQRVLVTGGAGFIGSNFVRHLLAARPAVTIVDLDALTYAGSRENLRDLPDPARHALVHGDITDRPLVDRLLAEHGFDTIVHFAAESHVDRSITGPGAFVHTNVVGTFTLLEAARAAWRDRDPTVVRFHHVSTDEVYGSLAPDAAPVAEGAAYAPRSPYAASKAASDHLVRAYATTYGLPVTISNCSNNYGPYQFPEKLVPLMIANALAGKPLPVYGDGQQVRDWLHVEDHCAAIVAIVERGRPGATYHVGGGNQPTNLALVHALCDLLDARFPGSPHVPHRQLITHVADRPGHDRRYDLACGLIERELGWRPRHDLATGLAATVAWYADAGPWLAAIRDRDDFRRWLTLNYGARDAGGTP